MRNTPLSACGTCKGCSPSRNTKTWLPDDLLVKADKMTMANSLKLRVPLPASFVSRHIFSGKHEVI